MVVDTSTVLLNRLISLRESSQFLLILDSLLQSGTFLILEFAFKCKDHRIVYLLFETSHKPTYASGFVSALAKPLPEVIQEYTKVVDADKSLKNTLVIVDSLNYVPAQYISNFVMSLARPNATIVANYHTNCPVALSDFPNYPSALTLLSYIANSIFEVMSLQDADEQTLDRMARLKPCISVHFNAPVFKLILTHRKKSGRSTTYSFQVDTLEHEYTVLKAQDSLQSAVDEESMLKDLTTFNLTTNSKQKLAKQQVELPFMEAQQDLGSMGGAIVYEFETDDDYDEEDPYEDPF